MKFQKRKNLLFADYKYVQENCRAVHRHGRPAGRHGQAGARHAIHYRRANPRLHLDDAAAPEPRHHRAAAASPPPMKNTPRTSASSGRTCRRTSLPAIEPDRPGAARRRRPLHRHRHRRKAGQHLRRQPGQLDRRPADHATRRATAPRKPSPSTSRPAARARSSSRGR